jgi:CheY-like chemotaxis protein
MSGLELLQQLQTTQATQAIPFILMSAHPEDTMPEEYSVMGVRVYLTKPFELHQLIAAINRIKR